MSATKRKRLQLSEDSDKDECQITQFDEEEGGIRIDDIYIPPPPKPVCSVEIGAPRLIIEKIVNRNFKSYAGEQIVGPFHKCFSSIMGPNGSGKSNVIDSLLFVFGYRASKIRSKKISVLIHSSENHQNITSCCVSVHFKQIIDKDDENFEEIPNSEFAISRTAFKDNSSYYEINDKRVHFKEVAKLLKNHGIDLDHNRFLILQGEVEQISMMKPKAQNDHETGMLEYLEDIIGTSRFKEPLQKLSVRIEELTDDRTEKVQKAKLIEKEKNEMQLPYEEAIRFLKTENYIKQLQNVLWQKYKHLEEISLKEMEENKKNLLANIKEINDTLNETVDKRKEKESSLNEILNKKNKLKKRLEQLKETLNNANKKDEKLQEDMVNSNKQRKLCMSQLADEKKKLTEFEKIPDKNKADIVEIEKKLERLNEEIKVLEAQKSDALKSVANETRQFNSELDELQTKLIGLNTKVEETKAAFQLAESELNIFMKNETDEKSKLEKISNSYNSTKVNLEEKQKRISELKIEIPKTDKELNITQKELQQLQESERKATEQLDTLRIKLEDSRSNMQNSRSRGRVLDALTQLKNEGKMPGFLGRLGDLGAIDLKYDVAVSTACGPLDHIIVEDVPTANACIDFLKKHNIGRANFIALDKQEHLRQQFNMPFKSPENVPRLFDLIHCVDERIKTAFYFGLRNTLVANDLNQATRIAYGARRHRVVTLAGQLIETSGTMSGGGNSVSRGRMGQKVLVDTKQTSNDSFNIQKLEDDVQQRINEVQTLREQQNSVQVKFNDLSSNLNEMKHNLKNYVVESESLSKQLLDLEKQLQIQQRKVQTIKTDEQKVKQMKAIIETKKNSYEQAVKATTNIKQEVNKIQTKITNITKEKTSKIQTSLSEKTKLAEKLKAECIKLDVGIKTSQNKARLSREKIVELEREYKNLEESIFSIQEERKTIEEDANQLLNSIEQVTETLENEGQDNTEIKEEISKLLQTENKLKTQVIDLENESKNLQSVISKTKDKIYCWQKKISDLILHDIPVNEVEIERNETLLLLNNTTTPATVSASNSVLATVSASNSVSHHTNKSQTKETLRILKDEELDKVDSDELQFAIAAEQDKITSKKPNLNIIEEYKRIQLQYIQRVNDVENVTKARQEIREAYDKVRKQRDDEFLTGYQIINLKLKEMYQMITLGGDAELELVDSLDPFNEGVSFSVRPPKKSWKNISNLSGGEKTLSSLALVFALHYYKPSPLYVMDEIDAALDFKNVSIVGNYIKERTKNAQFIIISLRSNMFELANRYVGIYKTHNCTKSATIDPQYYTQKQPVN